MVVEEGVVVMLGDKFWGEQYNDGRSSEYGYGDIKHATISDPMFLKKTTDLTYDGSHYIPKLEKGRLVRIKRITRYEVING